MAGDRGGGAGRCNREAERPIPANRALMMASALASPCFGARLAKAGTRRHYGSGGAVAEVRNAQALTSSQSHRKPRVRLEATKCKAMQNCNLLILRSNSLCSHVGSWLKRHCGARRAEVA